MSSSDSQVKTKAGLGSAFNSARRGFIPVQLATAPLSLLVGLPIFLRDDSGEQGFALFRDSEYPFTEEDRRRLLAHGVKFAYIRMEDQQFLQVRVAEADVPTPEGAERACTLVYETTVELVNELLANPTLEAVESRIQQVSRSVAGLVLEDPRCFEHLFKVARHDFYTATHVVNVATWMVPLAYACGMRDQDELAEVFQAGMLHDIGKIFIPAGILNKTVPLSDEDWAQLRRHPELGQQHLLAGPVVPELVLRVAREHHERCDRSGYPDKLSAEALHPASPICAVVDSFEAMTACRPHRRFAFPAKHAIDTLKREAGTGYARDVVEAWLGLIATLPPEVSAVEGAVRGAASEAAAAPGAELADDNRRRFQRYPLAVSARVIALDPRIDLGTITVSMQTISQGGVSFVSNQPIAVGERISIRVLAQAWKDRNLIGTVVRCRLVRPGVYDIGAQFHSVR